MAGSAGYRTTSTPVGRDREWDVLRAALRGADGERADAAGAPARTVTVIVHGEAGIGKTSLIAAAVGEMRSADESATVARGVCLPLRSMSVPFLGIRSALRNVEGPSGPHLPPPRLDGEQARVPIAVDEWIDEVTRRGPLVLTMDDLQWADADTLDVLLYLIANPAKRAVTLLASVRTREVDGTRAIDAWLADVVRLPRVETLELGLLDRASTADQITTLLGWAPDQSLIEDVYATTGGHPYLTELAIAGLSVGTTHLPAGVPETVSAAVFGAVELLSPQARALLDPLAINARPVTAVDLARIIAAATTPTDRQSLSVDVDITARLDEAARTGIVVEEAGRFWFRHPLTAELVEAAMSESVRRHWHAVLARLEQAVVPPAGEELVHALRLADHHHESGDGAKASAAAIDAAEVARTARVYAQELRLLRRALELSDGTEHSASVRSALLRRARRAAEESGELDVELTIVEEILQSRTLSDLDRAELLLRRLWLRTITQREFVSPKAVIAVQRLTVQYPSSWQHANALAMQIEAELGRDAEVEPSMIEKIDAAIDIARRAEHPPTIARALATRCGIEVQRGRLDTVRALAPEAAAVSLAARDWVSFNETTWCASEAIGSWLSEPAIRVLQTGRRTIAATDAPHRFVAWLAATEADAWLTIGEWRECTSVLRFIVRRDPGLYSGTSARFTAARLAALQGRVAEAESHIARIEELVGEHRRFTQFGLHPLSALVRLEAGDPAGAYAAAVAGMRDRQPIELSEWLLPFAARALADLVDRARATGADPSALTASIDALAHANRHIITGAVAGDTARSTKIAALALLYRGELARAKRTADEHEVWQTAADALRDAGLPWDEAYACQRWAESLLRGVGGARRVGAAGIVLRRGDALASRLRAAPVRAALQRLADAAGIRLGPDSPDRPAAPRVSIVGRNPRLRTLTGREREVLAHVVAGETYAQIATALFISEKTVSAHVSHLLAKTATTNRVELAQLATASSL